MLVDPTSKEPLVLQDKFLIKDSGGTKYPLFANNSPLLFPEEVIPYCDSDGIKLQSIISSKKAILQYMGISYVKWIGGEHNSSPDDDCYKKYLISFKQLVEGAKGSYLDIGCDDTQNFSEIFDNNIEYVGIDPLYFHPSEQFKIFAIAEFLPFKNHSFDNVCFGTSLDHVFDPLSAFSESYRVLKPGGKLFISTLIWNKNAELYNDNVHFHHFREFQIFSMLKEYEFVINRYFVTTWKKDSHRKVLFLEAQKIS